MTHSAFIADPGTEYFDLRRSRIVALADTHAAVVCRVPDCEWSLHLPIRLGLDRIELARRWHLKSAHLSGLISGQVVFSLPDSEVARAADVLGTQAGASTSAARGTAGRSSGLRRTPARPSQSRQSGRRSTRAG